MNKFQQIMYHEFIGYYWRLLFRALPVRKMQDGWTKKSVKVQTRKSQHYHNAIEITLRQTTIGKRQYHCGVHCVSGEQMCEGNASVGWRIRGGEWHLGGDRAATMDEVLKGR